MEAQLNAVFYKNCLGHCLLTATEQWPVQAVCIFMFTCMGMYVWVCIPMFMLCLHVYGNAISHVCMCMCDPRLISCVFLNYYPTYTWRKVLSLNPELSLLSSLASPWLCLPQYGITYSLPLLPGFNMDSGDQSSGPHVCKVSTLSNESAPQPSPAFVHMCSGDCTQVLIWSTKPSPILLFQLFKWWCLWEVFPEPNYL